MVYKCSSCSHEATGTQQQPWLLSFGSVLCGGKDSKLLYQELCFLLEVTATAAVGATCSLLLWGNTQLSCDSLLFPQPIPVGHSPLSFLIFEWRHVPCAVGASPGDADLLGTWWCYFTFVHCGTCVTMIFYRGSWTEGRDSNLEAGMALMRWSWMESCCCHSASLMTLLCVTLGPKGWGAVLTLPKPCNQEERAEHRGVLPFCFWPRKQYLTLNDLQKQKRYARKAQSTK